MLRARRSNLWHGSWLGIPVSLLSWMSACGTTVSYCRMCCFRDVRRETTSSPSDKADEESTAQGSEAERSEACEPCVVPGCTSLGKHKLGVRCRVLARAEPGSRQGEDVGALGARLGRLSLRSPCPWRRAHHADLRTERQRRDGHQSHRRAYADDRRTPIRHEPRKGSAGEALTGLHYGALT